VTKGQANSWGARAKDLATWLNMRPELAQTRAKDQRANPIRGNMDPSHMTRSPGIGGCALNFPNFGFLYLI
jgi:hypothetical protein